MSLGPGWVGLIGLVAATGGVLLTLASIGNDTVVLLGGRGLEGLWPLFFAGIVCILLGMSVYAASAAWAGLAPMWSVLTLVLGGAGTAMMVLLMVIAPNGVQRTVGEGAWMGPFGAEWGLLGRLDCICRCAREGSLACPGEEG